MQFEISENDGFAIVSIEGSLNALDLLFMLQSSDYKSVIAKYDKVLIDYSDISGSSLTMEDAVGITLLGKMNLVNQQDIHIAVAVNENERAVMEKVTAEIFSNGDAKVTIVESKQQGINILNLPSC
ncbi:hypothetical protein [uncultured Paraglaciecola sp.]|uniref:hypothetical protein n=1 Tax=uncultured Paraglaciecola sp. TaxID=1765024 RepID=UPI0025941BE1|nr:hypothetical protein [uncultured Paraglaciecola sp.]